MSKLTEAFKHWWTGKYPDACPSVGGQAVMEGVMMRGPVCEAITVRKQDGTIAYHTKPIKKVKHKWMTWPIIRGVVNFGMMLVDGMNTITESADMAGFDTIYARGALIFSAKVITSPTLEIYALELRRLKAIFDQYFKK